MSIAQPLFSRILGNGGHTVFALHCTMAHSGAWRGLSEAMSGEVAFHAVDMFNHGKSPDWDGKGDFQLRMAEAAFDKIDAPIDVVGHSFGATVALRMAAMRPEIVRRLVIIDSVHLAVVRQDHPEALEQERVASAPFREALDAGNFEDAARIFNRGWGDSRGPKWADLPETRRQAMTRGVQIVPACGPSITDDLPGLFESGGLDAVRMPVLLLRGAETEETVRFVHDGLARRLPQSESHVVAGAGHMVPITHPVETAGILRDFFTRTQD
ncbi:MAG: alpha/beta fold hydrolase [Arenibacterium sp.]